jgi:regulator of sirC expression with transglutaminase-like and TPR domain
MSDVPRDALSEQLADIGGRSDADIDLAEAALALAALDQPDRPLDPYRAHLAELGSRLALKAPHTLAAAQRAAALAETMAGFGYEGDSETYEDLANANLMQVVDRRRGLPVSLGILYIHLARSQGWPAEGVNFPGHFLVRIGGAGGSVVIDPFAGGRVLDGAGLRAVLKRVGQNRELRPDDLAGLRNRDILLRLQNNIKQRALTAGEKERAASVLGTMLLIAPSEAGLWLELSGLMGELGSLQDAVRLAERAAEVTADAAQRRNARALAAGFRQRLN